MTPLESVELAALRAAHEFGKHRTPEGRMLASAFKIFAAELFTLQKEQKEATDD